MSTNQTSKKHIGVRITLAYSLSRNVSILRMYSGVPFALAVRAGRKTVMVGSAISKTRGAVVVTSLSLIDGWIIAQSLGNDVSLVQRLTIS